MSPRAPIRHTPRESSMPSGFTTGPPPWADRGLDGPRARQAGTVRMHTLLRRRWGSSRCGRCSRSQGARRRQPGRADPRGTCRVAARGGLHRREPRHPSGRGGCREPVRQVGAEWRGGCDLAGVGGHPAFPDERRREHEPHGRMGSGATRAQPVRLATVVAQLDIAAVEVLLDHPTTAEAGFGTADDVGGGTSGGGAGRSASSPWSSACAGKPRRASQAASFRHGVRTVNATVDEANGDGVPEDPSRPAWSTSSRTAPACSTWSGCRRSSSTTPTPRRDGGGIAPLRNRPVAPRCRKTATWHVPRRCSSAPSALVSSPWSTSSKVTTRLRASVDVKKGRPLLHGRPGAGDVHSASRGCS